MASISPKDSILETIKKKLGIDKDDDSFDVDILWDINSAFLMLYNLGVGPNYIFSIEDETETWSEFLVDDSTDLKAVATYIWLNVRLVFDPPSTSFVVEAINNQISKLEFEMNVVVDDGSGGDS